MRRQTRISFLLVAALAATVAPPVPEASAETISELKKRARQVPRDPQQALELGKALRFAGLRRQSAAVLQRAYLRNPKRAAMLRYERARTLIADGQQKGALAECRFLGKIDKTRGDSCTAEAQLLRRRASLAVPAAEAALAASPRDYDALVAVGRALLMKGEPGPGEARLREAISVDSGRYEAHRYLGEMLLSSGKKKSGLQALRRAHRAEPRDADVMLLLAKHLPSGSESEKLLRKAVAQRPSFGQAHAMLGALLIDRGKHAEAERALRQALKIDKKQADWHAWLGRVLLAKGDAKAALKSARAALKLVANNPAARLVEADALAAKGEIDLAIEAYGKAAGLSRTDPAPLVHAARATLAARRPTTARAFADRATQEFPKWGPGWEIAGDIFAASKDRANARKAYDRALAGEGPVDKAAVRKKRAALD